MSAFHALEVGTGQWQNDGPTVPLLISGTRGCASHGKGSWGGGLYWSALVGTVSSQESLKGKAEEGDFGVRAGAMCPEPWSA